MVHLKLYIRLIDKKISLCDLTRFIDLIINDIDALRKSFATSACYYYKFNVKICHHN